MNVIEIVVGELGCSDETLLLGYAGEDSVEAVVFDFSPWAEAYGSGTITLEIMRASDTAPYTPMLTIDGTTARWTISDVDTAKHGPGVAQLVYQPTGATKKSAIYKFFVGKSLIEPGGDDPWGPIIERMEEILAEVKEQADAADQSAKDASGSAKDAEAWAVGERGGDPVPATDPTHENNAKYYADEAGETVRTFTETTAPAAVQAVNTAGQTQVQAVNTAGAAKVQDVNTAGATQVQAVNTAGQTALTAIMQKSTEEQAAIQQKGEDTLASIPEDYTELTEDVDDLKSAIEDNAVIVGDLVPNEYVKTDGDIAPYNGWSRTGYINIARMRSLRIVKSRSGQYNCFFDANHENAIPFTTSSDGVTNINVPTNAVYVMLSDANAYMTNISISGTPKIDADMSVVKNTLSTAVNLIWNKNSTTIANNTDYDTLTVPGTYLCTSMASAATMTNSPFKAAHRLFVASVYSGNSIIQIAVGYRQMKFRVIGEKWKEYAIYSPDIPEYYEEHIVEKEALINANIANSGFYGDSFAIVTDTHWSSNTKNSPALIKHIADHTPINRLMMLGDYYSTDATKAAAYKKLQTSLGAFKGKGMSMYIIAGNHDYNKGTISGQEILTESEVYGQIMTGQYGITRADDTCTFYFDNTQLKIRYYFTSCMGDTTVYNKDSYKWIFDNMQHIPDGYKVIVFTHTGLSGNGADNHNYASLLTGALKALKDKSTYTFDGTTYDYSGVNATPICIFAGHHHADTAFVIDGVACIQVTTDAYSLQWDESLTRQAGTTSEQAFDIATINTDTEIAYLTRIGAGYNRIIHCAPVVVTSSYTLVPQITGNLTWSDDTEYTAASPIVSISNGVITKTGIGTCAVTAKSDTGYSETWVIRTT